MATYKDERYGYRIQYPTGWSKNEETKQGGKRVSFIPDSDNSALLIEVIDDIGRSKTLPDYLDFAKQYGRDKRHDLNILNKRDTTLSNGQPAHVIEFRFSVKETEEPIRSTILITLHEERAYEVEFLYRNATYTETAEQLAASILDSFSFTE